ncbi:hypothetical protein ACC685_33400 [Rhizobium ruizarguesonis]
MRFLDRFRRKPLIAEIDRLKAELTESQRLLVRAEAEVASLLEMLDRADAILDCYGERKLGPGYMSPTFH